MRAPYSCVAVAAIASALAFAWSCSDPVHDAQVDALGPEAPGVPRGPNHRPGRPCLTCHGGQGPSDVELSVAGTIYQTAAPDSPPLEGATVTIFDATQDADGGAPRTFRTNAAGNFYARRAEWSPVYPLHDISISAPGVDTPTLMHTTVGRDGSCATCHFDPRGQGSHGHVYLVLEPADLPGAHP
ncbi:MAG: hypothetical protein JWP87_2524 [Labilithrix sp.]|nr:hypothetical protein [Labilithrix sp.]